MRSALLIAVLLAPGCAARSGYVLLNATRAVEKARTAGAPEHAEYEFTMAEAYLIKAQEENTYSEYQQSERLAKASLDWSQRAVEATEITGRSFDGEIVPEERIEKPVEEQKENTLDEIDLDEI
mgnify:CR=1 FL=1